MNLKGFCSLWSACFVILAAFLLYPASGNVLAQPTGGPGVEAFFNAIKENDTNTVFKMLHDDTNLVHSLYYGRVPLTVAVSKGCKAIVAELLKCGADINVENDTLDTSNCRLTPLDIAVWYDQPELCRYLLEAGADPNRLGYHDGGALHLAFIYRRAEMAVWLLDHGANPFLENTAAYHQTTPLDVAIDRGEGKLVPRMLKLMATFSPPTTRTNARSARFNPGRQQFKSPSEIFSERGEAWLRAAVQHGELEAVQALLQAGVPATNNVQDHSAPILQTFALAAVEADRARPGAHDQWQRTQDQLKADYIPHADPRFVASLRSQAAEQADRIEATDSERLQQIRELLLQHGANYDAFAATALDDTNQILRLLAADKNPAQSRDDDGQTPLHWAVRTDRLPLASFWIKAGVPLAATNSAGQTALHLAATQGKTEFVKILLAARAPTDIRDTNGWTPLDAAIQAKQPDSIRLLLGEKSAPPHPERGFAITLHEAAATGNIAALAALVETETNLEARDELGLTPLQVAVLNGHLAAAALLLDKGANLNARDPEDNTLLHLIFLKNIQVVHDLPPASWLEHEGQDVNKPIYAKYLLPPEKIPEHGWSPNPLPQVVCFLLAGGIDAKATNNAGETALDLILNGKISRDVFISNGERPTILQLLAVRSGDVDRRDAGGNTILHRSSNAADADEVDRLADSIASGADVNATNHLGQTPLHKAAEKIWGWDQNIPGTNEPFQLLVFKKANVNAQDNEGLTPLHVLAAADTSFKKEATELLLAAGANPNLRDNHERTPAHLFLFGKWPWNEAGRCIAMLVKAGADLSAKDDQGKTPLHYLAALGDQQPMFFISGIGDIFLAAKVDLNARDKHGDTPLMIAAQTGTADVFDWLIKHGADLDTNNNAGQTPRLIAAKNPNSIRYHGSPSAEIDIFQAVREGKTNSVARLLQADARLANATNQIGQTPLRLAVMLHQTNVMALLEKKRAEWDAVSAVMAGRAEVLQKILRENPAAITNTVNSKSLLHLAAGDGNAGIVQMLLDANADPQAADGWGLSPLGRALLKQQTNVVRLLRAHRVAENLFDAVYLGDAKAVSTFLAQDKALAKASNPMKVSAVEIAAAAGSAEVLKLLLKHGGSANVPAITIPPSPIPRRISPFYQGRSPLNLATFWNQPETMKILIRAGANVNQTDSLGFTPLHWAIFKGQTEAANVLLQHGANINQATAQLGSDRNLASAEDEKSPSGETPLHLAAMMDDTNSIRLLLKAGADVNAMNGQLQTPLDQALNGGFMTRPAPLVFSQISLLTVLEPFGTKDQPVHLMPGKQENQSVAASLIKASGGKNSHQRPPAGHRGFPPF